MNPARSDPSWSDPAWCDRCGGSLTEADHTACVQARTLEPPRFCGHCRRRLRVQVLPAGWHATCVQHGQATRG